MSRLFYTETGRALIANNEEVTRWRWAKKEFALPGAAVRADAELWLNLFEYIDNTNPLLIEMNGKPIAEVAPGQEAFKHWSWRSVSVPAKNLRAGKNEIILRCDTAAMNGWVLGLENGHANPRSWVSTDRGRSWRNSQMGAHNALRGEYLIRLRSLSDRLDDPPPPPIVYEDPKHPRVREMLDLIPGDCRRIGDPWQQVLSLRSWLSQAWVHESGGRSNAPWDPWTVLDWSKRNGGHGQNGRITNCVHFGAIFAALLTALGHKARCIINTRLHNSPDGHFMTEVWFDHLKQWVLHDANVDAHYEENGRPLSAFDLADRAGGDATLHECVKTGPGFDKQPPHIGDFCRRVGLTGQGWYFTGVWSRNNYISDPTAAPPNHGSIAYCETDIVWYNPGGKRPAPMFPFQVFDRSYFDALPRKAATRKRLYRGTRAPAGAAHRRARPRPAGAGNSHRGKSAAP